jgi:hypothetical protein
VIPVSGIRASALAFPCFGFIGKSKKAPRYRAFEAINRARSVYFCAFSVFLGGKHGKSDLRLVRHRLPAQPANLLKSQNFIAFWRVQNNADISAV